MKKLLLGNEAVARGVYEAGAAVATAYPGTPSTEITEYITQYGEIYAEWSPNEKAALEAAIGASLAGSRAVCSMKHVGLNVAADPLFTVSYAGVNGGLVICVADDPGMHSSQNEQDSRHYAAASKTLMLEPSDSDECRTFVKRAFELSETYDTPVLFRLTTRVSHSRSLAGTDERITPPARPYQKNIAKNVMMPAMARKRHEIVEARISGLTALAETTDLNRVEMHSRKIGVITSGIAHAYAREALGENASYLKLGMVYPLPDRLIRDFAQSVDVCYVAEELDPIIENHCKQLGIPVRGKADFSPNHSALLGEYTTRMIREAVLGVEDNAPYALCENVPPRPPVLCAGCPHRGLFYTLNQMKLTVSGDIGCYTLGAMPPLNAMDITYCMGASIGMAHGMEKASGMKAVAVIGDSTFLHSGVTGLINAVYNQSNIVVVIADNSITGMTGHQENPATGKTIRRQPTHPLDIVTLCEAVGVRRVKTVDPFDTEKMKAAIQEELQTEGPSVIISKRPCRLLIKGEAARYRIDPEKCRNCGVCMRLGCPAIYKREDKITNDAEQCAGCGLCARVCKLGAFGLEEEAKA